MQELLSQPIAGITITIAVYVAGIRIRELWPSPLCHPLLIGTALAILLVRFTPLTMEQYRAGGDFVTMFIVPATTVLALHIHRQWALLRAHFLPIAAGCLAGGVTSIVSVALLGRLCGLDEALIVSLQPKSVTLAIALELSVLAGGYGAVTIAAVVLTGISGIVLVPWLVKLLRLEGPLEIGVALGTCAHAIGTSKAIEIGEVEGAMGGIALVLTGVVTSAVYVLFMYTAGVLGT